MKKDINIKKIIEKYTAGKSTLILLVIPGNSDFTTSEAISLVRKNQDYKERTLAIITKIDLGIQQDRKIHEKIKNNELNLIFDPIIVRNRTQDELEKNIDSLKKSRTNSIILNRFTTRIPIKFQKITSIAAQQQ